MTERMEQRMQVNLVEALSQYGHMEREQMNTPNIYPPVEDPQANLIRNASTNDIAIHRALEALTARIEALATGTTPTPPQRGTGNESPPTINPRTGRPYKRYCWSHGCCAHWGRDCQNKKAGYKDEATFKDRMGGSNKGCLPVLPS